ncbi:O-antigen ligase family protein [Roseibium sp. HPY-6]|uniref:O-antigen ligase family protein n=1 Tax=Roseibium sp. HPY-6 TaxID=3229852 RepID=UPI0033901BAB
MSKGSIFIPIFLFSLALPLVFSVGPLSLSPYRLLLILAFIPATILWFSNKRYAKILPDFLVLFFPLWATIALTAIYGFGRAIEAGGIIAIETAGAYFLARVLVCTPERFDQLCKWLILVILMLLPFSLFETITERNIPLQIFNAIGNTPGLVLADKRWGFDRVQGPFEHPILYGVFCGMGVSIAFYYRYYVQSVFVRYTRTFFVVLAAVLSFSSGPLAGISGQIMLIGYDLVTRHIVTRWKILMGVVAVLWVSIDLLSTRSPPQVFITYFAFSAHSAYNRVFIWRYGTESILNNPLFGIGYEEYQRPWYVFSSSVDMFWILPSMQFGIPAGFSLLIAFAFIAIKTARADIKQEKVLIQRRAMMICLFGIFLSGWTVHFWNATYVLVVFMFGASVWFFTNKEIANDEASTLASEDSSGRHEASERKEKNKTQNRHTTKTTRLGYTRPKRDKVNSKD